jgi:ankyrin repeat protein
MSDAINTIVKQVSFLQKKGVMRSATGFLKALDRHKKNMGRYVDALEKKLKDAIRIGCSLEKIQEFLDQGLELPKNCMALNRTVASWESLILLGAKVDDYCDQFGNTLLSDSAQYLDSSKIYFLLKNNADVNRLNKDGLTPLMIVAAGFSDIESKAGEDEDEETICTIVKVLLSYGANVNLKDKLGNTVINYAHERKLFDVEKVLKEAQK